ncbi:hypothetical protein HGA88_06075 [Candidatus Roizmanbacteria bacterium]|nr:hypothetical protein [Candidatus Roizmanbacteria bacterium]
MRYVGITLIAIGSLLLLFAVVTYINQNKDSTHTPIPEDNGVKVIFVTPKK